MGWRPAPTPERSRCEKTAPLRPCACDLMLQIDGRNGFAPADEVARRFIAEGAKKSEEAARRAARRGRARGRR